MRVALTSEFEKIMVNQYPFLADIEQAIYEVMGVTLEQMRSKRNCRNVSFARIIFAHLSNDLVSPCYYLASYMDHDHGTLIYWVNSFDGKFRFDKAFKSVAERVIDKFNKNKQYGVL